MPVVKFEIGDKVRLKEAFAGRFIGISIQKIYEIIDMEDTIGGIALTLSGTTGVVSSRYTIGYFELAEEDIYTLGEMVA